MSLILGIDPGSRKTGFGIINTLANRHEYVASGVIRLGNAELPERLKILHQGLDDVINEYCPQQAAVEQVFMSKSPSSALKLGQARGAAIVVVVSNDIPVYEYEAKKVKQSVVGNGGADKFQVQHMVKQLLKLSGTPQEDAADALAVALCHANSHQHLLTISQAKHFRRGRIV